MARSASLGSTGCTGCAHTAVIGVGPPNDQTDDAGHRFTVGVIGSDAKPPCPHRARCEIAPSESARRREPIANFLRVARQAHANAVDESMLAIADRLVGSRTGSQLARRWPRRFHLVLEQSRPLTRT